MNNNAWSIVSYPPDPKSWEQHFENFRDHKNFPLIQSEKGDFYQDTTPLSLDNGNNLQRTPTYAAIHPRQQTNIGQTFSIPLHPIPCMNHDYHLSPTLGIDYSQMSMNQGRGSFVSFQNCRSSTPLSMAQVPFSSKASKIEDHSTNDNTSPNTVYSDLSTSSKIPPSTYESIDSSNTVALDGALSNWCSDGLNNRMNNIDNLTSQVPGTYAYLNLHDSQPILPYEQQHDLVGLWNHRYEPANSWPPDPNIPGTVRPKSLNLNASFTSTTSVSNITSSQTSMNSSAESTTVASSPKDEFNEGQSVLKQHFQPSVRHMLPSSRPIQDDDMALTEFSNSKIAPERTNKPQFATNRPVKRRRARASNPISSAVANTRSHTIIKKNLGIMDFIVPTRPQNDVPESKSTPAIDAIELHSRSEQDEFLVSSRRQGISYKQIRSKGKFSDAESTLRGRFRTLTKDKKDRVRKPKWTDNDLRLLNKAVKKLGRKNRDGWEPKVQWKKVAEYIADNGGSYRFGYATCRKRWLEIEELD